MERVLREGRVGEVFHFSIAFWQNIRADPAVPLGYRMLKERGGGALLDIGVHLMDTLAWWFGPLDAVCGLTRTVIPERDSPDGGRGAVSADDTASFVVRLAGGAAGTVQVSQVAHGRQNYRRFEVFGSEGSVVMEEDRTFGPQLSLSRPGEVDLPAPAHAPGRGRALRRLPPLPPLPDRRGAARGDDGLAYLRGRATGAAGGRCG